ncbi:hypothetical protein PoB_007451500 [Plakobranchus ocellatus]|uniref:Uncharacterized protein n=1 Tax=Plakobranchus ocellatus TaxID=259542 RepID=A0AAV4DV34_9GAST|nr:hypothetical protein PoB_007451500 [Plakobranchus ocellatus]
MHPARPVDLRLLGLRQAKGLVAGLELRASTCIEDGDGDENGNDDDDDFDDDDDDDDDDDCDVVDDDLSRR